MPGLTDQIGNLIGRRVKKANAEQSATYHASFQQSGNRKAKEIVAKLEREQIDFTKFAYFSLGGSTGAEVLHVLAHTGIPRALLLEVDSGAAEMAREEAKRLRFGERLKVITGDAMQQIETCKNLLLQWRGEGLVSGLICSAQAVFHELPTRSPGYIRDRLLADMFGDWDPVFFYNREPCSPLGWEGGVQLSLKDPESKLPIPNTDLAALANYVMANLNQALAKQGERFDGPVYTLGSEFVAMPPALAIEVLFKIFYLEDFEHEIQERVTSLDPDKHAQLVQNILGPNGTVRRALMTSDSFMEKYRQYSVFARRNSIDTTRLVPPTAFVWIEGQRWTEGSESAWRRTPRHRASDRPVDAEREASTGEVDGGSLLHWRMTDEQYVQFARVKLEHEILAECPLLERELAALAARKIPKWPANPVDNVLNKPALPLEKVIDQLLLPAVEKFLDNPELAKRDYRNSWEACWSLGEWLSVLSVDAGLVAEIYRLRAEIRNFEDLRFDVPVDTEWAVAAVGHRLNQSVSPRLRLPNVVGAGRVEMPAFPLTYDQDLALQEAFLALWRQIFPEERRAALSESDIQHLSHELAQRRAYGTHYHYVLTDAGSPGMFQDDRFIRQLMLRLYVTKKGIGLDVIRMTGSGGHGGLLLIQNERAALESIQAYFTMLRRHQRFADE